MVAAEAGVERVSWISILPAVAATEQQQQQQEIASKITVDRLIII